MKLSNVEEAILKFEPIGQDRALSSPLSQGVDYTLLKDLVLDHINSLQKINLKLGASTEIAEKLGELKAAYDVIFGHSVLDELNEGYADNVSAVANEVIKRSQSVPFTKEQLLNAIESEASYRNVPELKFKDTKSKAWPDFVKDVLAAVKGKVKFSRPGAAAAAAERKERDQQLLAKIARIIEDSVGEAFPDGDPTDRIWPRLERLGISGWDAGEWIDRAARKHLGFKSFRDYMGALYDDYFGDNPEAALQSGLTRNPYTNKPIDFSGIISGVITSNPQAVLDILSQLDFAKEPKIIATVAANKEVVLKALLQRIKSKPNSFIPKKVIRTLIAAGIDWPEFVTIQKSIDPAKIAETIKTGDVLTIENLKEAVVGTVISVENDTVIIEGAVYNFNETEQEKNKTHSHVFTIKPDEFKGLLGNGLNQWKHSYNQSKNKLTVYTSDPNAETKLNLIMGPFKELNEAKYQGREVKLGKPMAGDVKKYKVYVRDPKTGNIKKVNFGDKGMEIKRDDPERRKSFRARHGCGTPRASNRTKAAYWSCRMWSSKPVSKILKGK